MSFKILHTADWHLGKSIYGHSMAEDQEYFINTVLFPTLQKENPNIIIISGDIFDKQIAPVFAINLFNQAITKIHNEFNIPIAIISGNHDSPERLAIGSDILRQNDVFISTEISDIYSPIKLKNSIRNVDIYMMPHFNLAKARYFLKNEDIGSIEEAYRLILAEISPRIDKTHFNVLMSHSFVTGCSPNNTNSYLEIGGSDEISSKLFDMFDYVALGHLHSCQKAGDNGRYSGSPIHYSFDEHQKLKSMTIIELDKSTHHIRFINIDPLHKMRTISGMFSEIVELGKSQPSDDYICVNLEDKLPIYMPMEQLRVYFKNILTLNTNWMNTNLTSDATLSAMRITNRLSDPQFIFKEFLSKICLTDATDDDIEIFKKASEILKEDNDI